MNDQMKEILKNMGVDSDNIEVHVPQKEKVDKLKLSQMVAELCAAHADGLVCVFACADAEDSSDQSVAAMIGGSDPENPAFAQCVMTIAGKIFQATYANRSAGQVVVHRERDDAGE